MRTVGRLFIIALTLLFAAVALAAGERKSEFVIAQHSGAVIAAPPETSVRARPPLSSQPDPDQPSAEPTQVERERKMFAWLLLLLKEHRAAR